MFTRKRASKTSKSLENPKNHYFSDQKTSEVNFLKKTLKL